MMKAIYVVTVFQKISHKPISDMIDFHDFGDRHCVGWLDSFEEANCAVENNFSDIHDNMYEYAIIEKMEPGICVPDIDRVVYKWNADLKRYEKIETPIELSKVSNFGIG